MITKIYATTLIFLLSISWSFSQQLIDGTLNHDGNVREYKVFLPSSYQDGDVLPLVINMHGITSDATQQIFYSGLNAVADTANFIVVTPEGLIGTTSWGQTATHWNAYYGTGVDDLGFLDLLIDKMFTNYNIDLTRVYATGMSNGGFMSYRLGCELSNRIAAIASIAGSIGLQQENNCSPPRPMPVMEVHGTNDLIVPFNGVNLFSPSNQEIIDLWVTHNNCDASPDTIAIPNTNTTDDSTVEILKYKNGDEGSEVWFYIVENGGHTWPGSIINLPGLVTNQDFIASEHIWEFFKQFTHPNPDAGIILSDKNLLIENINIVARPSAKELSITSDTNDIQRVQLYDMLGRRILDNNRLNDYEVNINVPNILSGIYIVTVETDNGMVTKKVLF